MRRLLIVFLIVFCCMFVQSLEGVELEDKILKAVVKEGSEFRMDVEIFNYEMGKSFNIVSYNPNLFFRTSAGEVFVDANSYGFFEVIFDGRETGVNVGKIDLSDGQEIIEIPVVLEVESKDLLVDLDVRPSQNSLEISGDEVFVAEVEFFNLKSKESGVIFSYDVLDLNGESVGVSGEEVISVERQLIFEKTVKLPELAPGTYVFVGKTNHLGSIGTSADVFVVLEDIGLSPVVEKDYSSFIIFGVVAFLILFVFVLNHYWNRRVLIEAKDWRKQVGKIKKAKFGDGARLVRKLSRRKGILERAYAEKYISKSSYENGVSEINSLIRKAKKKL